ncbi:protein of unknown function [Tenacibaculum sp. 190130A14a]|uniref:Lipoprotein n=1 Tax=Tenacibaculum polynesiense TaxID=3137857 RepID=A0ABM9P7J6_9FLAO
MKKLIIAFFLISCSCSSVKNKYRKYDIEKGILTYSIHHYFKDSILQKIYFTNYGATEYIEPLRKDNSSILPILKNEKSEYIFVSDSMVISSNRGFDYIYEKLVTNTSSELFNNTLNITHKKDTVVNNKKCDFIHFQISKTGQSGKAILWKGIPIWVISQVEKGLFEKVNLISIDLESDIPMQKRKLMPYVDSE